MRKNIVRIIAMVSCVSLLAGCQKGNEQNKEAGKSGNIKTTTTTQATGDLIEQLKVKYAASENKNYTEPIYNLASDHKFVFENVSEKIFQGDVYSDIEVYSDSNLKKRVDIKLEEDYENRKVTLSPGLVFNYEGEDSSHDIDGTWGSMSKFYLVQYRDLTTNKKFDKPQVTVFTIAREMNTPTLKQSVATDGYYKLDWEEVEGADYYEVYYYYDGMEYAELELTTNETSCTYTEFKTAIEREERFQETYGETEVATATRFSMNTMLDSETGYFVVAKSNEGKFSGMSNICNVSEIASSVPVRDAWGEKEFSGTTAMVLPTHMEMEMCDGSISKMLIDYHECQVTLYDDGEIKIEAKIKNLPVEVLPLYFSGMEYEAFKEDMKNVLDRQDRLETKSVTQDSNVDIPYVPNNGEDEGTAEPETEEVTEETTESETEGTTEGVTEPETEETTEEVTEEETEAPTEEQPDTDDPNSELESKLEESVYANTSLGAWIGINLLKHEETISLEEFPEASDGEYLSSSLLEAYRQNPLIDIVNTFSYDYSTNSLVVTYMHSKEESQQKQMAAIDKAEEIAKSITKDSMSDFEKEEAINNYLCENASYNEAIYEYINEDGTISDEVMLENADSFHPYGILVDNKGVCESYSEAFLMIAKNAGLEVVIETGKLDGVNHEWNRVKIDGSWYVLDVTNNDNEYIPNAYFNLSDESSKGLLVPDKTAIIQEKYDEYNATNDEKEYYLQKGKYAQNGAEATELLIDILGNDKKAAVRVEGVLGEEEVGEIVKTACVDAGVLDGMYYYYAGILSIVSE